MRLNQATRTQVAVMAVLRFLTAIADAVRAVVREARLGFLAYVIWATRRNLLECAPMPNTATAERYRDALADALDRREALLREREQARILRGAR